MPLTRTLLWHAKASRAASALPAPRSMARNSHMPFHPLPRKLQVVRQRDSSSIHVGNAVMSVVNCSLWIVYFVAKGKGERLNIYTHMQSRAGERGQCVSCLRAPT